MKEKDLQIIKQTRLVLIDNFVKLIVKEKKELKPRLEKIKFWRKIVKSEFEH